jgi:hypothetical protein
VSQSIESKTSTSAVTYQYEFDVYEDNDEMQARSTLDVKRRMEQDGILFPFMYVHFCIVIYTEI